MRRKGERNQSGEGKEHRDVQKGEIVVISWCNLVPGPMPQFFVA